MGIGVGVGVGNGVGVGVGEGIGVGAGVGVGVGSGVGFGALPFPLLHAIERGATDREWPSENETVFGEELGFHAAYLRPSGFVKTV